MVQNRKRERRKMKTKYIASILTILLIASVFTVGLTINKASADPTTISIPSVSKTPGALGNTFTVPVQISNVNDLFAFDINITWDNSLIVFASLTNASLSTVWPQGSFDPLNPDPQTGTGYVRYAAVATGGSGYTGAGPTTLFTITFTIAKADNFALSTPIHFKTVKLSDSAANAIMVAPTDGTYDMSAIGLDIDLILVNPNSLKPYEYGKYFQVQVYAKNVVSTLAGYDLKVQYTSELLVFNNEWITWGFGTGTVDNSTANVVHVSIATGTASMGTVLLFTLTFKVTFDVSITHIWRTGSSHSIDATVSLDATYGNLGFGTEGNVPVTGITILHSLTVTINLIQGDVDCNGKVDVFDLRTVAYYYDTPAPSGSDQEKFDVKTDGTIDIFDLVVVATNFGYNKPDSLP
jgi:hypothetical protein